MTSIFLLNGQKLETRIPLDELYVLYKQVLQARARIVIQAYRESAEVGLDLRKIDPEKTFVEGIYHSISGEWGKAG